MKSTGIEPGDIPKYINNIFLDYDSLKAENEVLRKKAICFDKFYNVAWTIADVIKLYGHHEHTVRKYVKLGLIPTHPQSTDAKILIRASIAMQLNFEELKRKSRIL